MKRVLIATATIAGLIAWSAVPAIGTAPDKHWEGLVYVIDEDGVTEESPGIAQADYFLVGGQAGADPFLASYISFRVTTKSLVPRNAYTIWLIVFNRADLCTDGTAEPGGPGNQCGPGDFTNPATLVSVMYGTGGVSGVNGKAEFSGERRRGDLDRVLIGPGLVDVQHAEVHMVVRDHGEHQPHTYGNRQTQSFNGGCGPVDPGPLFDNTLPSRCTDVQTTLVSGA